MTAEKSTMLVVAAANKSEDDVWRQEEFSVMSMVARERYSVGELNGGIDINVMNSYGRRSIMSDRVQRSCLIVSVGEFNGGITNNETNEDGRRSIISNF
jgi:hypothetical protein